jgi:hypothetical protein
MMLLSDVRKSIQIFAIAMEEKLRMNDWRGGWEIEEPTWLLARLSEEIKELSGAIYEPNDEPNQDERMSECCDVANFAMMIFSQMHPETRELTNGR